MTTEILINVAPRENRAALIENGVLTELFVERQSRRGIVSNLYKGRVQRVLPGMQAAFIDVGLERTAFLHAADIAAPNPESTLIGAPSGEDIRSLVKEGDDILVQVVKDPMGTKGARLTTFVALPSRLMVYMPRGEGVGVSARIEDEAERARLKALVAEAMPQQTTGGYIVRTAAQGASMEQIREDIQYLGRLWQHVKEKGMRAQAGELVYEDLPLPTRILRDELARGVDRVLVDNATSHVRHAGVRGQLHAGQHHEHRAVQRAAADLRPARRRRGNRQGARAQRQSQIRRAPGHRPDRIDDHDRCEHRGLRRAPQSRGHDFPHQPRSGRGDRTPAQAAQPRAASSSSTSSTWPTPRTARRCWRRCSARWPGITRRPISQAFLRSAWWK